jgi:hypothetical protein
MQEPIMYKLVMQDMITQIQNLYRSMPNDPIKASDDMIQLLRAADKAELLMQGKMEELFIMESEDRHTWQSKYMRATTAPAVTEPQFVVRPWMPICQDNSLEGLLPRMTIPSENPDIFEPDWMPSSARAPRVLRGAGIKNPEDDVHSPVAFQESFVHHPSPSNASHASDSEAD